MAVRRRILSESYGLPVFSSDDDFANVCKDNARIDRFEIRYPDQRLQYANPAAVREFAQALAHRAGFASLGRNTERYNGVRFSNDIILSGEKIYFKAGNGSRAGESPFSIVLNANYNQFYQANDIASSDVPEGFLLEQGDEIEVPGDLLDLFNADNPALNQAKQASLDGEDNLLLRQRWHDTSDVLSLLPLQVRLCQQFIESRFDLDSRFPLADAPTEGGRVPTSYLRNVGVFPIFNWRHFSIPHLEVCWDFHCKDAIATAKRYEQPSRQLTTHMRTRYHRYSRDTSLNLVSHRVELIDNVRLAVYAKTPTRLRFEVVYFQRSLKSIFQRQLKGINDLRSIMDFVLDDATGRLRRYLLAVERNKEPEYIDRAKSIAEFLNALYSSVGVRITPQQKNMLHSFFSLISQSGRIVITQHQQRLYPLIDQLERLGVVERVNRKQGLKTRTYTFSPQYRWILQALTG